MASLRKAGAYSKRYARPYTRKSKRKSKNFIKAVPVQKINKFNMGKMKLYEERKFDTVIKVATTEKVQIRDNALEAARQYISRNLENKIPGQYYFEVRVYPHHILRENKMLTGAGADRMQTGMSASFGKAMGRAALLKQNQEIYLISTSGDKQIKIIKDIINSVKSKLPCKTKITQEKIKN
ncbi:MAG TPA: 50S ribosomal protein L16 [Candidatus Paceibacterota bacterium]|nr:50S ribosomal protein L16 [Candidatus Paceibacterota bacterium]